MTTVPITPVPYPPIEIAPARALWAARFLLGLTLELVRALWGAAGWFHRLPRENQGVLAVTVTAVCMGVYAVREMLADPRTWAQVFGPPGWVVGVVASLFIARVARRPIVLLAPFGVALWWFSPRVALVLVAVAVVAVYWTTKSRSAHGSMTKRRTLTGQTVVTAHFTADTHRHGKAHFTDAKGKGEKCSPLVAQHEGGHAAALVALGGTLTKARAFADGSGYCQGRLPGRPSLFQAVVDDVAFTAGGEVAVHSRSGCSGDQAMMRESLGLLPGNQRGMARTAGYAQARRAQHTHAHIRNRVANALITTGRYR